MSGRELILAVDIGTGATKAVLFDTDGRAVSIARVHYPVRTPHKGWSEQQPAVVFDGVLAAIREATWSLLDDDRVLGVAFSSQLYSVLAVDGEGEPLTNSIIWSDTRSEGAAQALKQLPDASGIHQRTGCPVDAVYPLAKIRWLKDNLDLPRDVRFVSIKEYVISRLVGEFVADWSVASATGLFDIRKCDWDETCLDMLDITRDNLSQLVSPRHVLAGVDREIMVGVGLRDGTPLVIGGGDGPLASVGVGAYRSSVLAVNVGTSAAARLIIPEPTVDREGRLWTYVVDENLWVTGGMVSSGGMVYDWFLESWLSDEAEVGDQETRQQAFDRADQLASFVSPGAEGLVFIPYLAGEQCPGWHPLTRGSFFGLDFGHKRGHLLRAVLEGITRSIYRVSETIKSEFELQFDEIRVTGGLATSPVWLQIAADMLECPIVVPQTTEGSARGAALLAAVSLGLRSSIEDVADQMAPRTRVEPHDDTSRLYQEQYATFRQILNCTRDLGEGGL